MISQTEASLIGRVINQRDGNPGGALLFYDPKSRVYQTAMRLCGMIDGLRIWTHPREPSLAFLYHGTPEHRIKANMYDVGGPEPISAIDLDRVWSVGLPEDTRDAISRWARDAHEFDTKDLKITHNNCRVIHAVYVRQK